MIKLETKNYNMISTEKQQKYWHCKYEYLTGEEILSSNQSRMIDQARFTCFPLGKAFFFQKNKKNKKKQLKIKVKST